MTRTLSERERCVYEAHERDGRSFAAIADELGISKASAATYHRRAVEKLGRVDGDDIGARRRLAEDAIALGAEPELAMLWVLYPRQVEEWWAERRLIARPA